MVIQEFKEKQVFVDQLDHKEQLEFKELLVYKD